MLRSNVFGKKTAYLGIVGHGLDLTRIIMIFAFLPEGIGAILLMIGGLPQLVHKLPASFFFIIPKSPTMFKKLRAVTEF